MSNTPPCRCARASRSAGMTTTYQIRDTEQIHALIRSALVEVFGLYPARITAGAHLADDLGVDSIDAVDLVEQMRRATGRKIGGADFRPARAVSDLARAVERLVEA